jgi:RNA polymerase sigma factor (sigma-70 family)
MIESKKIKEILNSDKGIEGNEGLIVTIAYRGMIDYIRSVAGREGKTGKTSGKAQQIFMTSYYMDYYSNDDGDLMDMPFPCKKNSGTKIYEHLLAKEIDQFMEDKLSKREKMIMDHIYKDGLKQKEIGKLFSVTESRINQVKTKAIKTIVKAMGE